MSTPNPRLPLKPSYQIRNRWAQELAIRGVEKTFHKRELKEREGGIDSQGLFLGTPPTLRRTPSGEELEPPPLPDKGGFKDVPSDDSPNTVAIIGAGAAGLFTGMVLDWLNQQLGSAGFSVDYEILESAATAGGRLFTYNFETGPNGADGGNHLYYDVGAMRFPDTPIMQRYYHSLVFGGEVS